MLFGFKDYLMYIKVFFKRKVESKKKCMNVILTIFKGRRKMTKESHNSVYKNIAILYQNQLYLYELC